MRSSMHFFHTSFSKPPAGYYFVDVVWSGFSGVAFDSARRGYIGTLFHPLKVTEYASALPEVAPRGALDGASTSYTYHL